jgi:hypothetical protein
MVEKLHTIVGVRYGKFLGEVVIEEDHFLALVLK